MTKDATTSRTPSTDPRLDASQPATAHEGAADDHPSRGGQRREQSVASNLQAGSQTTAATSQQEAAFDETLAEAAVSTATEASGEAETTETAEVAPELAARPGADAPSPTAPRRAGIPTLPRPVLSAAWLQKLGEMVPRAASGAWQSVQVSLGENEGDLTVQARRDEDRVQVAIRFTDPTLRALATEHADRLQSTLEARYGADVDLSFGAGGQDSEAADDDGPRFHPSPRTAGDTAEPAPTPTAAPRSGGAREWVG